MDGGSRDSRSAWRSRAVTTPMRGTAAGPGASQIDERTSHCFGDCKAVPLAKYVNPARITAALAASNTSQPRIARVSGSLLRLFVGCPRLNGCDLGKRHSGEAHVLDRGPERFIHDQTQAIAREPKDVVTLSQLLVEDCFDEDGT